MRKASLNPSLREFNRTIAGLEHNGNSVGLLDLLENNGSLPVRRTAAHALYRISRNGDISRLVSLFEKEEDKAILVTLLRTFGKLGTDEALPMLMRGLKHKEAQVRMEAAEALSRYNSEAAFQTLLAALKQNNDAPDRFVRQFAAESLGKLGDRRAFEALVAALNDTSDIVRPAVATALGRLGDRKAVQYLIRRRHTTPHPKGTDCAECRAIDTALENLKPLRD
jgi:HEAT repeat protein